VVVEEAELAEDVVGGGFEVRGVFEVVGEAEGGVVKLGPAFGGGEGGVGQGFVHVCRMGEEGDVVQEALLGGGVFALNLGFKGGVFGEANLDLEGEGLEGEVVVDLAGLAPVEGEDGVAVEASGGGFLGGFASGEGLVVFDFAPGDGGAWVGGGCGFFGHWGGG
jgi:hypothetical protein